MPADVSAQDSPGFKRTPGPGTQPAGGQKLSISAREAERSRQAWLRRKAVPVLTFTLTCGFGAALGALGGTRTPNLLIRSQMLYPLSYERWMPG